MHYRSGSLKRIRSAARWRGLSCAAAFLFCLAPLLLNGQLAPTLQVIDCTTGKGIPYATVYHPARGTGVTADSSGRFVFPLTGKEKGHDSLMVSSIGYLTKAIFFGAETSDGLSNTCLTARKADLPVATTTARRFRRERTHGNRSESRQIVSGWSVAPRTGAERGSSINLRNRQEHLLKSIRLHIAESTYDSLRLRFNLYAVPEPLPAARPDHSWLVDTDRSSGWVSVNVLEEEITLEARVFVSVEVVEAWSSQTENRLLLSAGLFTDGLYFREGHYRDWERAKAGLSIIIVSLTD